MKLLTKMTLRSLKMNKWRTLAVLFSIMLSCAMLVSVSTLASSAMNGLKEREIAASGNWHTMYKNVAGSDVALILDDEETKNAAVAQGIGYLQCEQIYHSRRPYLYITALNEVGFKVRDYQLLSGRFPSNSKEIMIPKSLSTIKDFPYRNNDTISATLGSRISLNDQEPLYQNSAYYEKEETFQALHEVSYQITGIYDDTFNSNQSSAGFDIISGMDAVAPQSTYDVYVQNNNVTHALYDHAQSLSEQISCSEVAFNRYLLLYEGVAADTSLTFMIKLLGSMISAIIVICSIIVIHNSFTISLSQRSRYLGMLASVGATRAQKRNSVFMEAFFLAVPSILIGTLSALGACAFIIRMINDAIAQNMGIQLVFFVDPHWLFLAVLCSLISVLISAWTPARRAGSIPPISAINQNTDILMPSRRAVVSPLIKRLFGFEAVLALKNQKRFPSRYRTVLYSLILSFVLFISISSFSSYLMKSTQIIGMHMPYNVQVQYSKDEQTQLQETEDLLTLEHMNETTRIQEIPLSIEDNTVLTEEFKAFLGETNAGISATVMSLDEASMKQLCARHHIDPKQLLQKKTALVVNTGSDMIDASKHTYQQLQFLKSGTKDITLFDYSSDHSVDFKLEGLLNEPAALDPKSGSTLYAITFYVSEETFASLIENSKQTSSVMIYYESSDPSLLEAEINDYVSAHDDMSLYTSVTNFENSFQQANAVYSLIHLLLYAFLFLISCICISNVANTLSSSFTLRTREHAMLKSVGMSKKQFMKMIRFEAFFYALKASGYGLILSSLMSYGIYSVLGMKFRFSFYLPLFPVLFGIALLFLITFLMLCYHMSLIKQESLIETIRKESI